MPAPTLAEGLTGSSGGRTLCPAKNNPPPPASLETFKYLQRLLSPLSQGQWLSSSSWAWLCLLSSLVHWPRGNGIPKAGLVQMGSGHALGGDNLYRTPQLCETPRGAASCPGVPWPYPRGLYFPGGRVQVTTLSPGRPRYPPSPPQLGGQARLSTASVVRAMLPPPPPPAPHAAAPHWKLMLPFTVLHV